MKGKIKSAAILGGDKRLLFLASSLAEDGIRVTLAGFDTLSALGGCELCSFDEAVENADIVIFPVPPLCADGSLNAPFSTEKVYFTPEQIAAVAKKPVFTSLEDRLLRQYPALRGAEIYDYSARDDFAVSNAVPTAEGAAELAMRLSERTISGSRVLVTGFGRVGRAVSGLMKAMGAEVTAAARKSADLEKIAASGYTPTDYESLRRGADFDFIFNTVPALIFDGEQLVHTARGALIIDLASLPGGVDFEEAHRLGIDARRALALPGKCSPKTAGEIIKNTVYTIIKEVGN